MSKLQIEVTEETPNNLDVLIKDENGNWKAWSYTKEFAEYVVGLEAENERLREYLRLISMNQFDDVLIDSWCREALRGEEE